jgi:hypothetical protein
MEAHTMKHHRINWKPERIKRLFRGGKNVSQIAQAIGYPPATGNNRVRNKPAPGISRKPA